MAKPPQTSGVSWLVGSEMVYIQGRCFVTFKIKNGRAWVAYWVEGGDACSCVSCAHQVQWGWGSNDCGEFVRQCHGGVLCKVYCDGDSSRSQKE